MRSKGRSRPEERGDCGWEITQLAFLHSEDAPVLSLPRKRICHPSLPEGKVPGLAVAEGAARAQEEGRCVPLWKNMTVPAVNILRTTAQRR